MESPSLSLSFVADDSRFGERSIWTEIVSVIFHAIRGRLLQLPRGAAQTDTCLFCPPPPSSHRTPWTAPFVLILMQWQRDRWSILLPFDCALKLCSPRRSRETLKGIGHEGGAAAVAVARYPMSNAARPDSPPLKVAGGDKTAIYRTRQIELGHARDTIGSARLRGRAQVSCDIPPERCSSIL